MERKITVTFEVTELEMPLIKAYSDALVNGTIDPIEDRITDSDELRDIIKNHEASTKGLLYAVTGATMKSLSKFHIKALESCAETELSHKAAQDAESWAAENLGLYDPSKESGTVRILD